VIPLDGDFRRDPANLLPLGPLSLEAYCRDLAEFKLVNMNAHRLRSPMMGEDSLYSSYLPEWDPDLIGVSSSFDFGFDSAVKLKRALHSKYRGTPVVIGGHMTTFRWEELLKAGFDACCVGEGESALRDLLMTRKFDHPQWKTELERGPEVVPWNKNSGNFFHHEVRPDDIPPYDFGAYDVPVGDSLPINLSTGCVGSCYFCTVSVNRSKRNRHRGIIRTMDDLTEYNRKWGVTKFFAVDDCPFEDRAYYRSVLKFIRDNGWKVHLFNVPLFNLEEEDCELISSVSVYDNVGISPDASCERVFRNVGKRGEWSDVKRVTDWFHKYGMKVLIVILVGYPFELRREIEGVVDEFSSVGADFYRVNIVQPLWGSDFYAEMSPFERPEMMTHDFLYKMVCQVDGSDWDRRWLEGIVPELERELNRKNPG